MSGTRSTASGRGRLSTMVRSWPTVLLTVLLLALAVPAGMLMAPALTGMIIAGYGFLVWMFQVFAGPPTGG